MPAPNVIPADKLFRLLGLASAPAVIDVRRDEAFADDPRLIPGAVRRPASDAARWADEFRGRSAVVTCRKGEELSHGVAAWLRHEGVPAEALQGGASGWAAAGLPMVPQAKLPARDGARG
jgi:rhodanese-related sulfurtransferase